ncbi:hypothetical protein CAPTEDRAFT_215902, partial [Capitella teleta]
FHKVAPSFINVIRDPIEGLVSHYFFNAFGSKNAPLSTPKPPYNMPLDACVRHRLGHCMNIHKLIPFFCGHDKACRSSNPSSLARAKRAVKESYLIVGLTEDLHAFMESLETLMPQFFRNASAVFALQVYEQFYSFSFKSRERSLSGKVKHVRLFTMQCACAE